MSESELRTQIADLERQLATMDRPGVTGAGNSPISQCFKNNCANTGDRWKIENGIVYRFSGAEHRTGTQVALEHEREVRLCLCRWGSQESCRSLALQ